VSLPKFDRREALDALIAFAVTIALIAAAVMIGAFIHHLTHSIHS